MRFRIMAPDTMQGASLKKHGCPDPRTIAGAIALNVENASRKFTRHEHASAEYPAEPPAQVL